MLIPSFFKNYKGNEVVSFYWARRGYILDVWYIIKNMIKYICVHKWLKVNRRLTMKCTKKKDWISADESITVRLLVSRRYKSKAIKAKTKKNLSPTDSISRRFSLTDAVDCNLSPHSTRRCCDTDWRK